MAELIEGRLGAIPEAEGVVQLLEQAVAYCHARNYLAHGQWWRFNQKTSVVTVRSGTQWADGRLRYANYTEAEIARIAIAFKGLGAELYKLRRDIEQRERSGQMRHL